MSRDYFAVDRFDAEQLLRQIDALQESRDSTLGGGGRWAVMLDLGFDHGRQPLVLPDASLPLYSGGELRSLRSVSPIVIDCGDFAQMPAGLLSCLKHVNGRPMMSLLQSGGMSWVDLVDYWRHCIYPKTSDGQRMVLRFADTRVSAALPRCLGSANWGRLSVPLSQWWIVDRSGALHKLSDAPRSDLSAGACEMMKICDAELAALLDAGMPDAVIDMLNEQLPELLPELGRAQLYEWVQATCLLARTEGVEDFRFIATLCAAVIQRPGLLSDPKLKHLLGSPGAPSDLHYERLTELLEQHEGDQ